MTKLQFKRKFEGSVNVINRQLKNVRPKKLVTNLSPLNNVVANTLTRTMTSAVEETIDVDKVRNSAEMMRTDSPDAKTKKINVDKAQDVETIMIDVDKVQSVETMKIDTPDVVETTHPKSEAVIMKAGQDARITTMSVSPAENAVMSLQTAEDATDQTRTKIVTQDIAVDTIL